MRIIPPAETFIINKLEESQPNQNQPPTPKEVEEWLVEFAKMHVTEALTQAAEKATYIRVGNDISIFKPNILNAYSLDNVE